MRVPAAAIVLALLAAVPPGHRAADAPPPPLPEPAWGLREVEGGTRGEQPEFSVEGETTVVRLVHGGGIGHTRLERAGDEWPRRVVIRFERFPFLEAFGASNERVAVQGFWGHANGNPGGIVPLLKVVPTGQPDQRQVVGRVPLSIAKTKTGFEVEIPRDLLDPKTKRLVLHWVDAHRG